eukprot:Tbor_TRINITY_DN5595_c2_g1::TRINITY_DN5595_c2_g1_i1::g.13304::m.13304
MSRLQIKEYFKQAISLPSKSISNSKLIQPSPNRRDVIPKGVQDNWFPHGWVSEAEKWSEDVLGGYIPRKVPSIGSSFESNPLHSHLFVKCLVSPSYYQELKPRGSDKSLPFPKEHLMVPPLLATQGFNIMKLAATTGAWYSGQLATDRSLSEMVPNERICEVAAKWKLENIVLYRHTQIVDSYPLETLRPIPPEVWPSVVVPLVGAIGLVHGFDVAADFVAAELLPKLSRVSASQRPNIF